MRSKNSQLLLTQNIRSLLKKKIYVSVIGSPSYKIKKDISIQNKLVNAGFDDTSIVAKNDVLEFSRKNGFPFLFLFYLHCQGVSENCRECCDLLSLLRERGFGGFIVVMDEAASFEKCYSTLISGANDYCIDSRHFILEKEIFNVFFSRRNACLSPWDPEIIGEMALFRSLGLSSNQIEVLAEFSKDFPRLSDLSVRVNKSEEQVRKTFSTVYAKLNDRLGIGNQAQLAHLLTICSNLGGIQKKLTFVPSY
jgi:hypothetical protein